MRIKAFSRFFTVVEVIVGLEEGDIAPHAVRSAVSVRVEVFHSNATSEGIFIGILCEELTFDLIGRGLKHISIVVGRGIVLVVRGVEKVI